MRAVLCLRLSQADAPAARWFALQGGAGKDVAVELALRLGYTADGVYMGEVGPLSPQAARARQEYVVVAAAERGVAFTLHHS